MLEFTNKQLWNMILPLFTEQFLVLLVGIADTFIVSYCGEAALSGVALVNSFNTIFINMFVSLAAGGAVVTSQYLGRHKNSKFTSGLGSENPASESVSQLVMISTLVSLTMSVLILISCRWILGALFGKVEAAVMDACIVYLRISAYSYPALAIYNAGAALFRSAGRTSITMYISIVANGINLVGNFIGVFVLKAGVAGVAWPTFIAHVFSAAVITWLCFGTHVREQNGLSYETRYIFEWNRDLLSRMLRIAVPNALESGVFQFVKVALSSVVASFGTYQIAANGIAQSFWDMASLACSSMGPVFTTVISQCMGAGELDKADYFFRKLLKITVAVAVVWETLEFGAAVVILNFYAIADETRHLAILIILLHNIFNAIVFPFAAPLGAGLRATGDVKFTMYVSFFTTLGVRLVFSWVLAVRFNMGVVGIAWAMVFDWIVRAIILELRLLRGKWREFRVI